MAALHILKAKKDLEDDLTPYQKEQVALAKLRLSKSGSSASDASAGLSKAWFDANSALPPEDQGELPVKESPMSLNPPKMPSYNIKPNPF